MSSSPSSLVDAVRDRYVIERELGRGGMATVYLARDLTGIHRDYHQVTDEPQYIDYGHMRRVASLIGDVARGVADLDHRPVVDQPKPDPNAPCQQ